MADVAIISACWAKIRGSVE